MNNSPWANLYPMTPVERYSIVVWGLFTLIVGISGNVLVLYSSIKHKAIKIDKVNQPCIEFEFYFVKVIIELETVF